MNKFSEIKNGHFISKFNKAKTRFSEETSQRHLKIHLKDMMCKNNLDSLDKID